MEVQTRSVTFPPFEGSGPRVLTAVVTFSKPMATAIAVLTGFTGGFASSDGDHNFGNLDVRVKNDRPAGANVHVTITYGLNDWSGFYDDKYQATVYFAVIAE